MVQVTTRSRRVVVLFVYAESLPANPAVIRFIAWYPNPYGPTDFDESTGAALATRFTYGMAMGALKLRANLDEPSATSGTRGKRLIAILCVNAFNWSLGWSDRIFRFHSNTLGRKPLNSFNTDSMLCPAKATCLTETSSKNPLDRIIQ